jgi:5-methylcytosine-specific restriction endonuclease McrA
MSSAFAQCEPTLAQQRDWASRPVFECPDCSREFPADMKRCPVCTRERKRDRKQQLIVQKKRADSIRKKISKAKRQRVYDRDHNRCLACSSPWDLTLDHILPLYLGGTNDEDNLQTLCGSCNSAVKGSRVIDYRGGQERNARESRLAIRNGTW